MGTPAKSQSSGYERALISIVRTLPIERVVQILDYARYVQSQAIQDFNLLEDDETEEEISADEARWDVQFAGSQDGLRKMADQVRAEIDAGHSAPMRFRSDRRLASG